MIEKKTLFIEPEHVVVNLLKADEQNYLTVERLFKFVSYLHQQLQEIDELKPYDDVVFDISFDSVERMVRHNDKFFDLIGETIVFRGDYSENADLEDTCNIAVEISDKISEMAQQFSEKFAA